MFRRLHYAFIVGSLLVASAGPVVLCAEDEVAKPTDRYAVPNGEIASIVKFLEGLETYQPTTASEILAYRQNARKAFETAAERIIKLEKDKTSEAYHKAHGIQLQLRLAELTVGSAESQRGFYQEALAHIKSAKSPSQPDLGLAYTAAQLIEEAGNVQLAKEAFGEFGKVFAASDNEDLAGYGEKMLGVARRLDLPGKKMKIEGTATSGEPFDWQAYRGKIVLVDYWATWCEPCLEELPNVKKNYEKYHDKGFDVVGISLDLEIGRLRRFLAEREIPWVCLFEEGAGENQPMANYYGVMRIPMTMLLDRDGKVVSMNIRGDELGRQLAQLLDPPNQAEGASQ